MKLPFIVVCGLVYAANVISGFCFDVPVHFQITIAAVNGSTGFSNYMQDNNIPASKQYPNVVQLDLPGSLPYYPPTASGLIEDGSVWEDNTDLDAGGARSFNHFYDPISKQGLSVTVNIPGFGSRETNFGLPSKAWGAIANAANPFNPPDNNDYSWQNARSYQSNSIVSVYSAGRDYQAGMMFRSVGQFVHLLEDTSQPQHARNEQHLDQYPATWLVIGGSDTFWRSKFEDWGRFNIFRYKSEFSPTNLDWVAAGFTKMYDFWDRNLYNGASSAPLDADTNGGTSTLGLAEWCNGNFLTVRGSYADLPGLNGASQIGVTAYPYPKTACTDLTNFLFVPRGFAKPQTNGTYRFTLAKTSQGVAVPNHCAIDLLAAYFPSQFTVYTSSVSWVHPDDPDVMASYHSVLIPKAIAYSTGLINYYFRGRLHIVCSSTNEGTGQFIAMNVSPQAFSGGGFRVFSDDIFGNRTEATDLSTTYTGALPTNDTITGTFTIPTNSTGVFTLAYFGTIGTVGADGTGGPLDPVDANIGCASIVFTNCIWNQCTPNFRGVVATGLEAGDGVWQNMYDWLKNFDVTTVPWGILQSYTFSDPSLTSPDNTTSGGVPQNLSNGSEYGTSQWFVIDIDGNPYTGPTGQRCQLLWPTNEPYGVYAVDSWNNLQTGLICGTGTTSNTGACGFTLFNLPMPNSSLPSPIPWNRCHYVAKPGLTPSNIQEDYVDGLAFGIEANYGGNWNTDFMLYPSPDDPFTGTAP